ncbi:MAG: ComEA family DNA-binding protein [Phycisphaerales bacterium]
MSRQRGLILLSVLVVLVIAALAGTTAMYAADARVASSRVALSRTQARASAWSGVQAALAELAAQRDDLLTGATPELTSEWTLFTDDLGLTGVVRLVPLGAPDGNGVSECGKLDVNTVTEDMLGKLPLVGPDLAKRIVAERATRPFDSVEDLMRLPGMTTDLLYGGAGGDDAEARSVRPETADDRPLGARDGDAPGALIEVLTAFSADPSIQSGVGEGGAEQRGKLRVNLNTPWSDELKEALTERFGEGAAGSVEAMMKAGATFKKDADVVAKLRELNAPPENWAQILDALTTCPDPYVLGRIDVNVAPPDVLACIPGIDTAAAADIVAARERLDAAVLLDPAWITAQGIIPPERFQQAVDHVTTRSLVWRVRVEAGRRLPDADESEPLRDRIVLDAVLDVSSERPRVAYLREVTLLDTARAMDRRLAGEAVDEDALEPGPAAEAEPVPPPTPEPSERRGTSPRRPAGPSGGPRNEARDNRGPNDGPPGGDRADRESESASSAEGGSARPTPTDRRRGRWTAGGGS